MSNPTIMVSNHRRGLILSKYLLTLSNHHCKLTITTHLSIDCGERKQDMRESKEITMELPDADSLELEEAVRRSLKRDRNPISLGIG